MNAWDSAPCLPWASQASHWCVHRLIILRAVPWEPTCSWSSSSGLDLLTILEEKRISFFRKLQPTLTHLTVLHSSPFSTFELSAPQPGLRIAIPWEALENSRAQATSQTNYVRVSVGGTEAWALFKAPHAPPLAARVSTTALPAVPPSSPALL